MSPLPPTTGSTRPGRQTGRGSALAPRRLLLAVALAGWTGCSSAPPVRVVPRPAEELHQDLDRCALHGDELSARTRWLLRLTETEESFDEDSRATLRLLHERALQEPSGDPLFALAELAYLSGKRTKSRESYLTAAVYAYLFLLGGGEDGAMPSAFDRRFRWACDIYNRSLLRALEDPADGSLSLEARERELVPGSLRIDVDLSGFPFETAGIQLLPADELDVVGLGFRVRDFGLGAPLIAVVRQAGDGTSRAAALDRTTVSATLFLRIEGDLADMESGLAATLELHSTYDATSVDVGGVAIPLEADPTATIAHGIELANLWRFDLWGLFRGRDAQRENGLILPRPFEPGRIPVVLVHGTASNPAHWAELQNSLHADPVIRARVQFWLFLYTSGNPIAYSAASLRDSLRELVEEHDPLGQDEALRHMVVVGHSQGGLLARLTGIHLELEEVSEALLERPVEELGLDEESLRLLRRCFDVEPVRTVDRLVFVATPHRGSFLATRWYASVFAKLIAVPGEIESVARGIVTRVPRERLPPVLAKRVPTSLDNMHPDNPTLRLVAEAPIDPRIHVHSIVAIGSATDPQGADDGVVAYESAHLEEAESEVLVPSTHSCQAHPRTIIELRRILREHIRALDEAAVSKP